MGPTWWMDQFQFQCRMNWDGNGPGLHNYQWSTVFDPYWGNWARPWSTPATLIPKNWSKWTHVGVIRPLKNLPDCLLNQIRKIPFGPIWQLGWYFGFTIMVPLDNGFSYSLPIFELYGFYACTWRTIAFTKPIFLTFWKLLLVAVGGDNKITSTRRQYWKERKNEWIPFSTQEYTRRNKALRQRYIIRLEDTSQKLTSHCIIIPHLSFPSY